MDRVRQALGDSDDLVKVGIGAAVAVVFGGLGPWYDGPAGDVLGTDGGGPGLYVIALGAMAGFVLWNWNQGPSREKLIGVAICAGGALALMGVDALDGRTFADLGWGLILGIAGSIALLAVSGRLYSLNPV